MPFVKRTSTKHIQSPNNTRKIFIGRTHELQFFIEDILKPEDPTYNVISVSGNGGVGKSTLLARFINEAGSPGYKDYCVTALVDEQQSNPYMIMEKFAEQLNETGTTLVEFEKALIRYKEVIHKLRIERETAQDAAVRETVDLVGTVAEEVPVVGGLIHKGANVVTDIYLKEHRSRQLLKNSILLEDPIVDLTKVFVEGLNNLTDTQITLSSNRTKRLQRVILFFDTFEQLTDEVAPWLLNHFLQSNISTNVIIVVAGRDSIEQSTPADLKRWLPLRDNDVIYFINLDSFTEDETRTYLATRGIIDPDSVATIWQLSRGLPLYLGFLTFNLHGEVDPTEGVVANFLHWIPEQEHTKRRLALDAALFSKPFSQEDLAAFKYLPESERIEMYHWLIKLPFVQNNFQDGRYRYHELAQEMFRRHQFQRFKREYYVTSRELADHYNLQISQIQKERGNDASHDPEWLETILALVYQLFILPDEASHIDGVEQILYAFNKASEEQVGEIVRFLRDLSQEQPNKQVSIEGLTFAKYTLQYIEAKIEDQHQKVIETTNNLLNRLVSYPTFSLELLIRLHRNRGLAYRNLKEYQRAIEDYSRAIELDPTYVYAYNSRGLAYADLEEYQRAIEDYSRAIELDPTSVSAYNSRGDAYADLEEYQRAIEDYNRAIELNPTSDYAYNNRGLAYAELEEYQRAIEDFNRAIELDPTSDYAYNSRGLAYRNLKEYQRAIEDYNRAIELNPTSDYAYNNRGLAYRNLEKYQRAIEDYNRAIELDPTSDYAYNSRGDAYAELEEYQRAIEDYNRAIELDPTSDSAYNNRGLAYAELEEYQRAIEDYSRAIELDPTYVYAYNSRGDAYAELEEYQRAIEDFNRAIELDPTSDSAYNSRGLAYADLEEYQRAIEDYNRAIELDPTSDSAYNSRGDAYAELEEYQRAIEDFNRAIELDPTYVYAYRNRGDAYAELKEYQRAIEDFNRAIELDPDFPQTYYARGFAYTWLKDIKNTIANFSRCKELDATDIYASWAVEWLGMCLGKDDPGRIERLKTIAAINPENTIAYTCLGVASWLSGSFEEALLELDQAILLDPELGGAYFWKAMALIFLRREKEAFMALEKAIKVDWPVPPMLLTLLDLLAEERPDFYNQFALPFLENALQI